MIHVTIFSVGESGGVWKGAKTIKIMHKAKIGPHLELPPNEKLDASLNRSIYHVLSHGFFAGRALGKVFGIPKISDLEAETFSWRW